MSKANSATIGRDEWMIELQKLTAARDDEGMTVREFSQQTGHSRAWIQTRLKDARDQGRLQVGKRSTLSIDGRKTFTPVYRILPAKAGR